MSNSKIHDLSSLQALIDGLPENSFVAALFMHSVAVSQDEWLNPLALHLRDRGMVTIGIRTPFSQDKCDLGNAEHQAVIDPRDLHRLKGINVLITSDMDCLAGDFPADAKVLGCVHAFDYAAKTSMPYATHFGALLDGWFCHSLTPQSMELTKGLWNGLINCKVAKRKSDQFWLIPTAYPRLGVLSDELRKIEATQDAIIYAPIGLESNPESGGNRLQRYSKRIIRTLLASFPALKVIFRPYKNDLNTPEVLEIEAAFRNEPRFILDTDPGRAQTFSRGQVLVTDLSHIAKSYACATLKPAIYFQPWQKSPIKRPYAYGHILSSYTDLVAQIREYLENMPQWEKNLRDTRDATMGNPDNALGEIARQVEDFYYERPQPGWLGIDRSEKSAYLPLPELVGRIMRQDAAARPGIASVAALWGDPANPLLFALALHLGLAQSPKSYLSLTYPLAKKLSSILGKTFTAQRYGEVEPEDIRRLYALGHLHLLKKHDVAGAQIAHNLQEDFDKAFPRQSALAALPDSDSATGKNQSAPLNADELSALLAKLPEDTFVVGLYINVMYAAQHEWLNALAGSLRAHGYATIAIFTPQSAGKCAMPAAEYQAVIDTQNIQRLGRVNVFIISDRDRGTEFPQISKVLGCVHSFYNADQDISFSESPHFMASLDGWMEPMKLSPGTRRMTSELWNGLVDARYTKRKSSSFHLIPVGYPRLAAMLPALREYDAKPDAIVYAPVRISHADFRGGNRVRSHGLRIIRTLLDNFPAYKVIFRPSFQDTADPAVKEILAVFGDEPRFVFDSDPGQIFCFQHAAAVVTDLSNVVKSFAFSTLRPGIFFRPWQPVDELFYRNSFGFSTCSYEGLVETVRLCTENAAGESARIAKNRAEQAMPIESAFDEIAQWLPNFYHDRPQPHWLTIERGSCVQTPDENGLVEKLSLVDAANAYLPSAVAAIHRNPESPLLCAFALHCGFKHTPARYIYHPLLEIISKHAGFKMPYIPYGRVYPHIIKNLYAKALEQKTERNDGAGIELVKKLMADLEDICAARGVED